MDAVLAFVRDAPIWQLVIAFFIFYVSLLIVGGPLRKRWSAQRDSTIPNIGHQDNRSVTSHNQRGGQTAWEITNVGQQPREINAADADALVEELPRHPSEECSISTIAGVPDGSRLAHQLADILNSAGWSVSFGTFNAVLNFRVVDVTVYASPQNAQAQVLIRWLGEVD
jgi:hypothetical protein